MGVFVFRLAKKNLFAKIYLMKDIFKLIFIGALFLLLPVYVFADSLNEQRNFFVESSYDFSSRKETEATLVMVAQKLYFYVDNSWWKN